MEDDFWAGAAWRRESRLHELSWRQRRLWSLLDQKNVSLARPIVQMINLESITGCKRPVTVRVLALGDRVCVEAVDPINVRVIARAVIRRCSLASIVKDGEITPTLVVAGYPYTLVEVLPHNDISHVKCYLVALEEGSFVEDARSIPVWVRDDESMHRASLSVGFGRDFAALVYVPDEDHPGEIQVGRENIVRGIFTLLIYIRRNRGVPRLFLRIHLFDVFEGYSPRRALSQTSKLFCRWQGGTAVIAKLPSLTQDILHINLEELGRNNPVGPSVHGPKQCPVLENGYAVFVGDFEHLVDDPIYVVSVKRLLATRPLSSRTNANTEGVVMNSLNVRPDAYSYTSPRWVNTKADLVTFVRHRDDTGGILLTFANGATYDVSEQLLTILNMENGSLGYLEIKFETNLLLIEISDEEVAVVSVSLHDERTGATNDSEGYTIVHRDGAVLGLVKRCNLAVVGVLSDIWTGFVKLKPPPSSAPCTNPAVTPPST